MISVGLINSERVHAGLGACLLTIKSHHQWISDNMINMDQKRRSSYFSHTELEILMHAYAEQEHIFTQKSNTAAAARARERAWQEIAEQVNA